MNSFKAQNTHNSHRYFFEQDLLILYNYCMQLIFNIVALWLVCVTENMISFNGFFYMNSPHTHKIYSYSKLSLLVFSIGTNQFSYKFYVMLHL